MTGGCPRLQPKAAKVSVPASHERGRASFTHMAGRSLGCPSAFHSTGARFSTPTRVYVVRVPYGSGPSAELAHTGSITRNTVSLEP